MGFSPISSDAKSAIGIGRLQNGGLWPSRIRRIRCRCGFCRSHRGFGWLLWRGNGDAGKTSSMGRSSWSSTISNISYFRTHVLYHIYIIYNIYMYITYYITILYIMIINVFYWYPTVAECLPVSVTNTKISNQKDTYFRNFHCHLWTVESGEYNQPNHATSSFCMAKSHQIAMFGSISVRQITILEWFGKIIILAKWLNIQDD